jgi:hypothetical protein
MNRNILQFVLSNHFLHRRWERGIDRVILYKILRFVKCTKCEKDVIIVLPSFLEKKGIRNEDAKTLILILSGKLIKTVFWSDDPNYFFDKKENQHYQLLF